MLRFIVRRLLQLIPTLGGLSILLFVWLQRLPGGPEYALLPDDATAEQREALRRSLGLDQPFTVQYLSFLRRIAQGDLGTSLQTGRPVLDEFFLRFPATFELAVSAMIIAVTIGLPLGYLLGLTDMLGKASGPVGLWQGLIAGLSCAAVLLSIRLARSARKEIRRARATTLHSA